MNNNLIQRNNINEGNIPEGNNVGNSIISQDMNNNFNKNVNNLIQNSSMLVKVKEELPKTNIPVDIESEIPPHLRTSQPNSKLPSPVNNGGLFSGPQAEGPYASIYVPPTATNYIHHNLLSANPPPGATEQYVGTNRLGNNYIAMPGVYWYDDTHPINVGPYAIKVTDKSTDLLSNKE